MWFRRRDNALSVAITALLGVLLAVALIYRSFPSSSSPRNLLLQASLSNNAIRISQMRSVAASNTVGMKVPARFSVLDATTNPKDLYQSAAYLPENESLAEAVPDDFAYECGGSEAGQTCFDASDACLSSAESVIGNLYEVDPVSATETRANSVCKCFVSNGCSPSCNVALYSQWATRSGILCPANPPTFDSETGVFQYGDPEAAYIAPSDLSFDFYPNYPNPSGHEYSTAWARDIYEDDPAAGLYQRPLHARFRAVRSSIPAAQDLYGGRWAGEQPAGLGLDGVYCGDDGTLGCGEAAMLAPPA